MSYENAIIVQSDRTILLDTHHPRFEEVKKFLNSFAELVKTPEHTHFYKITPISLWNAAANGVDLDYIIDKLNLCKKYGIPESVIEFIKHHYLNYGKILFEKYTDEKIKITVYDINIAEKVKSILKGILTEIDNQHFLISKENRGYAKSELTRKHLPVKDIVGFESGSKLEFSLRKQTLSNNEFKLRYYQSEAVYSFSKWKEGSGVIVLPCGTGKTIVGIGIMADIQEYTLIITASVEAVKQWKTELLDKTTLQDYQIGEYTSKEKKIKPVTITTYNMLIYKNSKEDNSPNYKNISLFSQNNWGLIIYDEAHLLPAPIFKMTATIQSKRRLGLTATLLREDNNEEEVFSLIGPKIYESSWKNLEREGFIAEAICYEISIELSEREKELYFKANQRHKFRIAAENAEKINIIKNIIKRHSGNHIIIIGQYLDQLRKIAEILNAPLITGATNNFEREKLYQKFRDGDIEILIISKVGNMAIDLPIADVLIQISGTFGSRQEETQRLGRILRPVTGKSYFYTLISRDTVEEMFAKKRRLFLIEQGYSYNTIKYSNSDDMKDSEVFYLKEEKLRIG